MRSLWISVLSLTLGTVAALAVVDAQSKPTASAVSSIAGQVTFLYYNDLSTASAFYGKVLGERPTFSVDWVTMYRLSPTSVVGLVNATRGSHHPSTEKPVMVSLVVNSPQLVDQWRARLKQLGVAVAKEPHTSDIGGGKRVRSLMFKDPEGYTLEVFAWEK